MSGVKNYNTSVKKRGDEITFLRRIVRGGADGSYGIEVAQLAGIPKSVVGRAREILAELEETGAAPVIRTQTREVSDEPQMSFESGINNDVIDELKMLDVNTLTPIEALTMLYEIKKKLQ